jgi:protoporphyrinogen oxidase
VSDPRLPVVILGAGPAGLGAAFRIAQRPAFDVTVLERTSVVGGNAGSFDVEGHRVDFGSHRLHPACSPEIMGDIRRLLGDELLRRPRHGRIRLRGRWIHFPLKPLDLAAHLPLSFAAGVIADALPLPQRRGADAGETFESVLRRGLGSTICRDFYFPYASKIWGLPPSELDAEQARRRVAAGSISRMARKVLSAVPGFKPRDHATFYYPLHGYGQISEGYARASRALGARIQLDAPVKAVAVENGRVCGLTFEQAGSTQNIEARQVLSTIPVPALLRLLTPGPPDDTMSAAGALQYRAMVLVYLVLECERFTEYDAHYFPEPHVAVTRLSEPKNYSLRGPSGTTVLCSELPCAAGDRLWATSDDDLGALVVDSLARAELPVRHRIRRVVVRRLQQAYPIYTRDYRAHFDRIDSWVSRIDGLLTLGRQGLFVHDNTHHTLAMAYAAAECLGDNGVIDRARWATYRRAFESHVVED